MFFWVLSGLYVLLGSSSVRAPSSAVLCEGSMFSWVLWSFYVLVLSGFQVLLFSEGPMFSWFSLSLSCFSLIVMFYCDDWHLIECLVSTLTGGALLQVCTPAGCKVNRLRRCICWSMPILGKDSRWHHTRISLTSSAAPWNPTLWCRQCFVSCCWAELS